MNAQTAKITPGAWSTDTGGDVTREDGTTLLTREQPSDCALDESFANAELAAEAGTVANETGLTPRQLADQRAELLEALRVVVADWTEQFERNGHLAPSWCRQARAAIARATGEQP